MVSVVFHPIAEDDLGQIFDFIAADSPERAIGFVRRIKAACAGLTSFPERGRAYRIEDRSVVILRVFYAGQQIDKDRFKD